MVFENCTFQNGVNPRARHPGQLWGHEGLNNIWCRNCRFLGECVYASYLDGCHGSGMINCTVELSRFNSGGFLCLTNDDFTEDIKENGRIDREEERTAKYIVIYKNVFNGNNNCAVQVTGENILVTKNVVNGNLRYFVGSDPRWASTYPELKYHFYHFKIISNRVRECSEALLLLQNVAPVTVPKECEPPAMGKCAIRDNIFGRCPQLAKEKTLGIPVMRDRAVWSDKATFDGPNLIEGNRVSVEAFNSAVGRGGAIH